MTYFHFRSISLVYSAYSSLSEWFSLAGEAEAIVIALYKRHDIMGGYVEIGAPGFSFLDFAGFLKSEDFQGFLAWYDNEMGYTHTLLRHVKEAGKYL